MYLIASPGRQQVLLSRAHAQSRLEYAKVAYTEDLFTCVFSKANSAYSLFIQILIQFNTIQDISEVPRVVKNPQHCIAES